jgi:RNA polymerase sigma factor (sigma-70 family)
MPISAKERIEQQDDWKADIRSADPRVVNQAFALLLRAYSERLYRTVRQFSVTDENAAEICQMTWIKVLKLREQGRSSPAPDVPTFPWLRQIAIREAKHWKRTWARQAQRDQRFLAASPQLPWSSRHSPEDDTLIQRECEWMRGAIQRLAPAQREAIKTDLVHGLDDASLRRQSRSNAARGLQALRRMYRKERLDK